VTFAQNILGTYWPVSAANQLTAYVNSQMAVPGEAAVFTGGPFGHVAVVTGPGDGFCIAGGTPILTDRGEVPIELVEPAIECGPVADGTRPMVRHDSQGRRSRRDLSRRSRVGRYPGPPRLDEPVAGVRKAA